MNEKFIVLGWTGVALAADDTQSPTQGPEAGTATPDSVEGLAEGLLVDGMSR